MTNPSDPINSGTEYGNPQWKWGLTKREYFAAMAMNGLLQRHNAWDLKAVDAAWNGILYADALIAELNKDPK